MEYQLTFQVDEAISQRLENTLTEYGYTISQQEHQTDDYYLVDPNSRYLRLRHLEDGSGWLEFQRYAFVETTEQHEVQVSSVEEMERILEFLGYKQVCCLDKERTVYTNGKRSVCFDFIKTLGHFVELMIISEQNAGKEVWAWAKELELAGYFPVNARYPDLMV